MCKIPKIKEKAIWENRRNGKRKTIKEVYTLENDKDSVYFDDGTSVLKSTLEQGRLYTYFGYKDCESNERG